MTTNLALMVPDTSEYDGVVEVHSPFDGKLIATLDAATADTVAQALTTAHALSLIHISEPTRRNQSSRMPSSA